MPEIETMFDAAKLVDKSGLTAPGALAHKIGVAERVDEQLHLPAEAIGRANAGTKAMTVIGAVREIPTQARMSMCLEPASVRSCSTRAGRLLGLAPASTVSSGRPCGCSTRSVGGCCPTPGRPGSDSTFPWG